MLLKHLLGGIRRDRYDVALDLSYKIAQQTKKDLGDKYEERPFTTIIAKMVEGRLRKFYEEEVLLEQTYVIDNELRVKQVVEKASKELGTPVKLTGFARFALGEGIQKEEQAAAE